MIGAFIQLNESSTLASVRPVGYVVAENACWLWVGYRDRKGYGVCTSPEEHRTMKAHRYMYERKHGRVPAGLVLDHFVCDNPSCVNPDHVRPVTSRENTLRSTRTLARQESDRTHCVHGHLLAGDNLRSMREGKRRCRICKNANQRRIDNARRRMLGVPMRRRALREVAA
jgi:hypothetical protein